MMKKVPFCLKRRAGRVVPLMVLAALAGGAPVLVADDVTEQVDEAMKAYADKDYVTAAQGLDLAAQMIRQMRGESLTRHLPEPLKGWTASEVDSQAAGAAIYGGGVSVARQYYKDDAEVNVQLLTDSPILQSVMMMFSMPMVAGSSGMKIERIKGQKAMVNAEENTISIVVASSMLVQISGDGCDLDVLRAYAEAIDYNALASSVP